MKISELSTDRAMDVFCELVPFMENIFSDEQLIAELKKKMDITEETTNAEKMSMVMGKINVIAPILLKKRRNDVLGMLAAINGKTVDEVKKQNFIATLVQVREVIADKDFIDFFKSFAGLVGGA